MARQRIHPPKIAEGDGDPRHGTAHGYIGCGCRCAPCTVAAAEKRARYYKPKPPRPSPLERFHAKVRVLGNGCWEWTGCLNWLGYGKFWWNGKSDSAYVAAYELFVGPVPDGMHIDHLCHTNDPTCDLADDCPHRRCVNPQHLEPVTPAENRRRGRSLPALNRLKKECKRGHEFTAENTLIQVKPNGQVLRSCNECRRLRVAWRAERARARQAAARAA